MYWKTLVGKSVYSHFVSWCRTHPRRCLSLLSAGYITVEGTKELCNPMPPMYNDYLSIGVLTFGVWNLSNHTFPLMLPSIVCLKQISNHLNDLFERRKQYLLKESELIREDKDKK